MKLDTNPKLQRFTRVFDSIFGTDRVKEICRNRQGQYKVELLEDAEYQDIGTAFGEEMVRAGYAITGVHQHYTDGDNIDMFTFIEIEYINDYPTAFLGSPLSYDPDEEMFTRLSEGGEGI